MKKNNLIFSILILFVLPFCSFSQQLVMDNDGYIVISNSAYLVIGNSASTGIVQTGTGGRIISEAEGNIVRWLVSNSIGTYVVPFYEDVEAVEIPVTATITAAGTASATNRIDFSTYDGGSFDNATYMPTGVTNMGNVTVPAANNSAKVTDRFWILDANHATKPAVDISFTYVDNENIAPNTLAEANLKAQRWNTAVGDWDGFVYPPIGAANTVTNIVSGAIAPAADFYRAWTLVDFTTPLPIELISNEAICSGNNVVINWSTASETNNNFFTIQKSIDGINFIDAGVVAGAGNSTSILNYSFTDYNSYDGISYYRLTQTDYNGNVKTFGIITAENCNVSNATNINAFNNQAGSIEIIIDSNSPENYIATLFDALGKKISSKSLVVEKGKNSFQLDITDINSGVYFISIESRTSFTSKKVFIH